MDPTFFQKLSYNCGLIHIENLLANLDAKGQRIHLLLGSTTKFLSPLV